MFRSPHVPPRRPGLTPRSLLALALIALVAATVLPSGGAAAQDATEGMGAPDLRAETVRLAAELTEAQRDHVWRVLWWGGANVALGGALITMGQERGTAKEGRYHFGLQSAAWGAINIGIAAWAMRSGFDMPEGPAATLAAEDRWNHILLVNLGLNVGYMAVGAALEVASRHGVNRPQAVSGHGQALILQGAGLVVLDGIAWLSSRGRLEQLHDLAFTQVGVGISRWDPAATELMFRIPIG